MRKIIILGFLLFGFYIQAQKAKLSNFRIENTNKNRVYFDVSGDISGLTTQGFVISGKTITGVNTAGNYFTVSQPFTFWDNNTIRLGEIGDTTHKQPSVLYDFTLQYIENYIPEPETTLVRYITDQATGSGDGLTEATAWTFNQASSNATAGMTIWVKAGTYEETVIFGGIGTITEPLKIVGYKTTPGDISENYFVYDPAFTLDPTEMPVINHAATTGAALRFSSGTYTILRNLSFESGYDGVLATGGSIGIIIDNCIGVRRNTNAGTVFKWYIGYEERGRIINTIVFAQGMSGVNIMGNHMLARNTKVYNNATTNLDYYISSNGENNIIIDCELHRKFADASGGHGFSLKSGEGNPNDTAYNLVVDSRAYGSSPNGELRNSRCHDNVFDNVKFLPGDMINETINKPSGVSIRDGAYNNMIKNSLFQDIDNAFYFRNNKGDAASTFAGSDNYIVNCVGRNLEVVTGAYTSLGSRSKVHNTKVINCTWDNITKQVYEDGPRNFGADGVRSTNEMINCSFTNINGPDGGRNNGATLEGFWETYSNYWNVGWVTNGTAPNSATSAGTGEGNVSFNPEFVNASVGDYRLNSSSKIKDKGTISNASSYDPNGIERYPGSVSIGAYQYNDNTTGSVNANAGQDQTICLGENVTLTASGGTSYSWSTGATTKSITVSPNTTTTYTVTVSDGNASDTDSVVVTVNSVTANAGSDVTINEGESITLSASGGGTYLWSNGATTQTITVSPNITSTYSVTVTNNACEDTDEVVVTVNQNNNSSVNANAGQDQTICLGENVTLTASGGTSYSWSTGATTKSITVNPNTTTTYTVTVSDGNASDSDSVVVTVNSVTANAGSDVTINEGESITLSASGGGTYLWSNGATAKSITVNPQQTTTYSVTVYKNGCEDSDSVQVTVNPNDTSPPPAKANAGEDVTICLGESVKLTGKGGKTYVWSTGEKTKNITVSPTRTTTYTLTATRGGVTNSDTVVVTVENCSALDEGTNNEFIVYPNPSNGTLNIKAKNNFDNLNLNIYSINGSIVYKSGVEEVNNEWFKTVDLSNLTKGVYIVRLYNANYSATKKVLLF